LVQCEQRESTAKSNDMDQTIGGSGPTEWLGELAVVGSWERRQRVGSGGICWIRQSPVFIDAMYK
jgi:hypothetical protein